MKTRTAKDIRKAADLIETYGWQRFKDGSTGIGFCINGALIEALGNSWGERRRREAATKAISDRLPRASTRVPSSWYRITTFNDYDARDAGEVIGVLRAIADDLKGG